MKIESIRVKIDWLKSKKQTEWVKEQIEFLEKEIGEVDKPAKIKESK